MSRAGDYYIDGPVPETPSLASTRAPWTTTRVVGTRRPRVDAYERVSGTAVYPSDVILPDMLYGAILRCPHAHARVLEVDTLRRHACPAWRWCCRRPTARRTSTGATAAATRPSSLTR